MSKLGWVMAGFFLMSVSAVAQKAPIQIHADLTDGARKFYHAEIDLPVKAGPLGLVTPEWIPGHHEPGGSVNNITGVTFTANGKTLPWRRDDVDLYEYHVVIPTGMTTLHVHLDCIVGAASRWHATNSLAVLEWENLMMYPAHTPVRQIPIQATVTVPKGWGIGTSLKPISAYDPQHPAGGTVRYAETTVEMLQDSPVLTGKYFHEYALAPDTPAKQFIDVAGDDSGDETLRPVVIEHLSKLVHEASAMYSSRHYDSYHFLLTLSKSTGYGGLEHHESSDNSLPLKELADDTAMAYGGPVLAHEYTHSWNGKYRRPAGLATVDFATPMKGDLLWVYEGLTDYLGEVLGTRSGFLSPQGFRESLALTAANLDYKTGRQWRSTGDTATSVAGFTGGSEWANWRRSTDYYSEGDLLWLDVDTTIRKLTNNQKNLHDFLVIFVGKGGVTPPMVLPYDFDELVTDLNQVVRNDWAAFLHERVDAIQPRANLEGITQGGYELVYTDKQTDYEKNLSLSPGSPRINVWFSIGLSVGSEGEIRDVRLGGPADKAGAIPGEKIIAVDGHVYSNQALAAAIKSAKGSPEPIRLILQNENLVTNTEVDYHDGERYPTLRRVEGSPAYLDDILKPATQ
jgi:predicted metalloprotease with PDZ domain